MAQSVDDLISELEQQTENSNIETSAPADHPSFDAPIEETEQKPADQAPVEEPVSKSSAKDMAKWCVDLFSGFMKMTFVPLYKWAILEEGDIKKMATFQQQHKGKSEKEVEDIISSDSTLWPVVNRFDRYMEATKNAGLTDEEKDMVIDPLANYIVANNLKLSPGWMLVLAIAFVMLPRLTRLIPSTSKTAEA